MSFEHIHKTTTAALRPSVLEEFIERTLLENMKPAMVHSMDAQKRTLPLNNGKYVKFRKFDPLDPITTPLLEGVTPAGQDLNMTSFSAMVKPYGGHIEVSDELDLYMIDNISKEAATLLADQAALSLDTISRNALNAGANVQYVQASGTGRANVKDTDVLTYAAIKKAVRSLKNKNVKPFSDGFYHAIVHPDVVHDLTSDQMWTDVAKYAQGKPVSQYELGCIYKVKFFESTNAMVFKAKTYLFGTTEDLTASADYVANSKKIVCGSESGVTEEVARELTGQMVYISANSKVTPACIERVDAATKTFYLRWDPGSAVTTDWTTAKSLKIVPYGGGYTDGGLSGKVYSTLIYGADAFGSIELAGGGSNVQIIVKDASSGGAENPLNQRGSVAWKVKGFCTVILQDDFIIRVESGATQ